MPLTSIQKIYRLFSQFFSEGKKLILRLLPGRIDCCKINYGSNESSRRVSLINKAAPDCVCEKHRMSYDSPHPINDNERITRFVFIKNQLRNDNKSVRPSFFSQVDTKGCSIQRESIVNDNELVAFVKEFKKTNPGHSWLGVVTGGCHEIRSILTDQDERACCVYDTGNESNPAHGEMCRTHHIKEADKAELRRHLMKAFHDGLVIEPDKYRDGKISSQIL